MVQALRRNLAQRSRVAVDLIETHISYVLVCGELAYKIKKALRTPFLDQSTVMLRQRACQEELRLNRRLAPDLYLAVVPISGSAAAPVMQGRGALIDVAVKMRAFAQAGLWDRLAERGQLGTGHVDQLAGQLARFHARAEAAAPGGTLGAAAQVRQAFVQSLDELENLIPAPDERADLALLRAWEQAAFDRVHSLLDQRLALGRVRECHGDLHLGNVTLVDGCSTAFDGIEFNAALRWIDVINEVAFLTMDLQAHRLPRLAHRFLNTYLEHTGDYGGVPLLDYYGVYRALVRAKVHALRAAQLAAADAGTQGAGEHAHADAYLHLALELSRRDGQPGALLITHGYSGSGKTTLTQGLLEAIGAIRIRADVERKRLAGLPVWQHPGPLVVDALYDHGMTARTYGQLSLLAGPLLDSGYPVILDATFLRRCHREMARQLAAHHGVPFIVLAFDADTNVLRQRLRQRAATAADASDADDAVLEEQMRIAQPLQADEGAHTLRVLVPPATDMGAAQPDWPALLQGHPFGPHGGQAGMCPRV